MSVANLLRGWSFDKETLPEHLGLEELPGDDELLYYLLEIDIREYGLPVLVDIQSSTKNIPRDIVVQVKKFKNVCVPESSLKSEMFDTTSKGVLRYYLTDGHNTISAVALDSDIKLKKGTKVLFHKNCSMETGFIVMNPKYFTVLGGGIKEVEKKLQITDGEESKILRSAPKFADLMKSMATNLSKSRPEPRTENRSSLNQPAQTVRETEEPVQANRNTPREARGGGKPPRENNRPHKAFNDDSRQQNRGSRSGRGEFRFNAKDQEPPRMVYEDYEHDIGQSFTFTRSSANADGSSSRHADTRQVPERRPRTEPREQRDNIIEHRNNRNEERGQQALFGRGRGVSGGRGGNRGGRGRGNGGSGPSRGRGGGQRMQGGGISGQTYSPAQPQFNAMDEFDFPSLGDAISGMHLH